MMEHPQPAAQQRSTLRYQRPSNQRSAYRTSPAPATDWEVWDGHVQIGTVKPIYRESHIRRGAQVDPWWEAWRHGVRLADNPWQSRREAAACLQRAVAGAAG